MSFQNKLKSATASNYRNSNNAEQKRRAARFGTTDTAGPSTAKPSIPPAHPSVLPARPSALVLGKRTKTESEEMAGSRKRVELDTLKSVQGELNKGRGRVEVLQEDERRLEEDVRRLRVRLAEERENVRRLELREEELEGKR